MYVAYFYGGIDMFSHKNRLPQESISRLLLFTPEAYRHECNNVSIKLKRSFELLEQYVI